MSIQIKYNSFFKKNPNIMMPLAITLKIRVIHMLYTL